MSKPSSRKADRQRNRRLRKQSSLRAYKARRAAEQKFPDIFYDVGAVADDKFVVLVKQAVQDMVRDHERLLTPEECDVCHRAKDEGFLDVLSEYCPPKVTLLECAAFSLVLHQHIWKNVAKAICSTFPAEVRDTYFALLTKPNMQLTRREKEEACRFAPELLCNYFIVALGGPNITQVGIRIRSLQVADGSGGRAFFSPLRPTLKIDGQDRIVAFRKHAIEGIQHRTVSNQLTFAMYPDAISHIYFTKYFELVDLPDVHHDNAPYGFTFVDACTRDNFRWQYVENLVPDANPDLSYYYRVGYCPADLQGDFIVGRTLLIPGMKGTPEQA